jgi:CTP:molybdopterin cytidylyltransferase MocA
VAPALLAELRSIDEESLGIKAVVRRHEAETFRLEVADPEVLWDLNTPEEYQAALEGGAGAGH